MPLLVLHYQFKNNIIATHPRSLDWDGSGHVDAVLSGGHRALESNVMHGSATKVRRSYSETGILQSLPQRCQCYHQLYSPLKRNIKKEAFQSRIGAKKTLDLLYTADEK